MARIAVLALGRLRAGERVFPADVVPVVHVMREGDDVILPRQDAEIYPPAGRSGSLGWEQLTTVGRASGSLATAGRSVEKGGGRDRGETAATASGTRFIQIMTFEIRLKAAIRQSRSGDDAERWCDLGSVAYWSGVYWRGAPSQMPLSTNGGRSSARS